MQKNMHDTKNTKTTWLPGPVCYQHPSSSVADPNLKILGGSESEKSSDSNPDTVLK
jgi:hypothetical protein